MIRLWKSWKTLSSLIKRRLIYLVLVIFLLDFMNIMAEQQRDLMLEYQQEVGSMETELSMVKADLEAELSMARADLEDTQIAYTESLRKIVKNLYEGETYGTGGFEIGPHEDIDILYEVIMAASLDFTIMLENTENYFDKRKEYVEQIPSIWPMEFSTALRITSGFGWRLSPFTEKMQYHSGIDIASMWNSKIIAPADGIVVEAWPPPNRYWQGHLILGGMLKIKHVNGFETVYGHMAKVFVHEGDEVVRGQVIGIIGDTGKAKGRHLHYEVLKDGKLVNPIDYLSSNRVLVMSTIP